MTSTPALPRPPRQARTREGWERILAVGLQLLEEGGWESLTIAEVCRRARVTAPTIYARVDGREGLFTAVYQHGMDAVHATEARVFAELASAPASPAVVAAAVIAVFDEHRALLRAVIRHSSSSPELLASGSAEARRLIGRVRELLPLEGDAADFGARVIFSECLIRVMYGPGFYEDPAEPAADLAARLGRLLERR